MLFIFFYQFPLFTELFGGPFGRRKLVFLLRSFFVTKSTNSDDDVTITLLHTTKTKHYRIPVILSSLLPTIHLGLSTVVLPALCSSPTLDASQPNAFAVHVRVSNDDAPMTSLGNLFHNDIDWIWIIINYVHTWSTVVNVLLWYKEIRIKQLFYYVLLCYIPVLVVNVSFRWFYCYWSRGVVLVSWIIRVLEEPTCKKNVPILSMHWSIS